MANNLNCGQKLKLGSKIEIMVKNYGGEHITKFYSPISFRIFTKISFCFPKICIFFIKEHLKISLFYQTIFYKKPILANILIFVLACDF